MDTIVKDLMDASMALVKELKTDHLRGVVGPAVEARILEALTGPGAAADTVESFRSLLQAGALDDREIVIDVPVKEQRGGCVPVTVTIELMMVIGWGTPCRGNGLHWRCNALLLLLLVRVSCRVCRPGGSGVFGSGPDVVDVSVSNGATASIDLGAWLARDARWRALTTRLALPCYCTRARPACCVS